MGYRVEVKGFEEESGKWSCSIVSNSETMDRNLPGSFCQWDFPGESTEQIAISSSRGSLPTQVNLGLPALGRQTFTYLSQRSTLKRSYQSCVWGRLKHCLLAGDSGKMVDNSLFWLLRTGTRPGVEVVKWVNVMYHKPASGLRYLVRPCPCSIFHRPCFTNASNKHCKIKDSMNGWVSELHSTAQLVLCMTVFT